MWDHRSLRVAATLMLAFSIALFVLGDPQLARQSLNQGVTLWWNHLVPIMLPGYVLSQLLFFLWPKRPWWTLSCLAFFTFPPLAAMVLYDHLAATDKRLIPLLLYTNLYNPLLFPHPDVILRLDTALFAAAALLWPNITAWHLPSASMPLRPRQWVLDAMNWTSIVGFAVVVAVLLHQSIPHWGLGWFIDPLGLHWIDTKWPNPVPIFLTAWGGLAFWIPLWVQWSRHGPWVPRILLYRLTQSLLATALFFLFRWL